MTLSMTWGGTAISPLPDNEGLAAPDEFFGSAARMADASLRVDYIAEKRKIPLKWSGLTYAQLTSLRAVYDAKGSTSNTLALPDGRSFSVIAVHNGWREGDIWYDHAETAYYPLTITLDEV